MRRKEFLSDNLEEFRYITDTAHVGHLGLVDHRGYPRIVPLNFVAIDKDIYFHGASGGEKYELIKNNPQATFSVDIPYSFIPSYWMSEKSAVPTTYFFKSLHIRGAASIVENVEIRAEVLNKMMEKFQSEGGYTYISPEEPIYRKKIREMGIFRVKNDEFTLKLKFGQNLSDKKLKNIVNQLKIRGSDMDLKTVREIQKHRPEIY